MIRSHLFTRSALGLALALGTVAGVGLVSTPAFAAKDKKPEAPKVSYSKAFIAVAGPLQKEIEAAKVRPDVVAAKQQVAAAEAALKAAQGAPARASATTTRNQALAALGATIAPERAKLDTVFAAVTSPDDKMGAGRLAIDLGSMVQDSALQRRGLNALLESGKLPPAEQARMNFFAGSLAYDAKEYAAARTALSAAIQGGYRENDVEALLADSYIQDNQVPQGIAMLKQAITEAKTAGRLPPANWFRRGLGVAYKNRQIEDASFFSRGLVEAYPTTENWSGAITVVREIAKYPAQEVLDLMRLMERTKSFSEERDYIEYVQAADARRLPGEVSKIINQGLAANKLNTADLFVSESRSMANARIAADRASLAGLERDARAGNATAATAMAAGDAYLSYDDAAKAREFYTIALGKPGVDTPRVLTRLGIAQSDLGQYAEAQATFGKIEGPRKALAQLWTIYVAAKAKPAS